MKGLVLLTSTINIIYLLIHSFLLLFILHTMKHHFSLLLYILVLLLHQNCFNVEAWRWKDGFVKTRGVNFMLNGFPFYANGFNAYWLMYMASDPSDRRKVTSVFQDASARGLSVCRTWAFSDGVAYRPLQSSPGIYKKETFEGLDFVVAEARKYGIKLILSFVNNWDDYGGKKQYVKWANSQGQNLTSDDDFFRNHLVKKFYKNHVRTVVNRFNNFTGVHYKHDPTIMAWELMNEPRCQSDPSGKTVQAWIREMAAYVKWIDRKHLLEIGLEGFYGQSTPQRSAEVNPSGMNDVGTDFIANNKIHGIDFGTIHAYPDQWLGHSNDTSQFSFLNKWMDAHIVDSKYIVRKPILLSEFGKSSKDPGYTVFQRDRVFYTVYHKVWVSARTRGAAAGGLFWQLLAQGMDDFNDGYGIVLGENSSTEKVIAEQSRKLDHI